MLRFVPLIREVPIQIFISGSRKLTANCIATSRFAVPDLFSHCSFFVVVVGTHSSHTGLFLMMICSRYRDDFHCRLFTASELPASGSVAQQSFPSAGSSGLLCLLCLWIENQENRSECRDIQHINK